tara:strand:+ start:2426 stop:3442 length:1017 start_codon:yes stop_codon:yes gene_type:complete
MSLYSPNIIRCFLIIILLSSCDQEIDFHTEESESLLVVEGVIECGKPTYVILTKSEHFFAPIDGNTLDDIFIENATVYVIKDNGEKHKLVMVDEDMISIISDLFPSFDYTLPMKSFYIDTNTNYEQFSQPGHSYKLEVYWNNDTITSNTTIPYTTEFDSVWCVCEQDPNDYKCYIWTTINDPDTTGNNLFFQYKRIDNSKSTDDRFRICARFLRNDHLYNGLVFPTFFSRSGQVVDADGDGPLLPFYQERIIDGEYLSKDIVLFKISEVNKNTYDFLRSRKIQQEMDNNPFAQTTNLISNINGGLGIWAGYNATYYKIPIIEGSVIYEKYEPELFEIF